MIDVSVRQTYYAGFKKGYSSGLKDGLILGLIALVSNIIALVWFL